MHIWHNSTVISRVSLYLHLSTQQLNPTPKVSPCNCGKYHFTKTSLFFLPKALGSLPFQTNLCLKVVTMKVYTISSLVYHTVYLPRDFLEGKD